MGKTRLYRIIAIVCAALFLVLVLMSRIQSTQRMNSEIEKIKAELGERQKVLAPIEDIPAGTVLTADLLKQKFEVREYLQRYLPTNVVSDSATLEGQVVLTPLFAKEPVLTTRLGRPDEASSVSFLLPQGRMAFALPTSSERAVGDEVRAGDRIDVIVAEEEMGAQVLLSDVLVMGRAGSFANAPIATSSSSSGGAGFSGMASNITFPTDSGSGGILILELSPADCLKLVQALSVGDVYVALRSRQ